MKYIVLLATILLLTGCQKENTPQSNIKVSIIETININDYDALKIINIEGHEYYFYCCYRNKNYSTGGMVHNPECKKCEEVKNGSKRK